MDDSILTLVAIMGLALVATFLYQSLSEQVPRQGGMEITQVTFDVTS